MLLGAPRRPVLGLQHQPRYSSTADDMLLEDFVQILPRAVVIPDSFRIDHHVGPELAPIEASGGVYAYIRETELLRLIFEVRPQLHGFLLGAAAARMAWRPLVGAAEHVQPIVRR